MTQSGVARITFDGDIATVTNVRMGDYPLDGERAIRWGTITVDLNELTNVHFLVHSWGASVRGVAHSMVSFEFAGAPNLVCSVEARLRRGQRYNVAEGFRRSFELSYNWCTERDALLERAGSAEGAASSTDRVASLQAEIAQHGARRLFRAAAQRTNDVATSPEWYHAATNSCSANIIGWVDQAMPGQVPHNPRWLLPGYLPEYLVRKGLVRATAQSIDTDLMTSADMLPRARELIDEPRFEALLHERGITGLTVTEPHEIHVVGTSLGDLGLPQAAHQQLVDLSQSAAMASGDAMVLLSGPANSPVQGIAAGLAAATGRRPVTWQVPALVGGSLDERERQIADGLALAIDETQTAPCVLLVAGFDRVADRGGSALDMLLERLAACRSVVICSALSHRRFDTKTLAHFDQIVTVDRSLACGWPSRHVPSSHA